MRIPVGSIVVLDRLGFILSNVEVGTGMGSKLLKDCTAWKEFKRKVKDVLDWHYWRLRIRLGRELVARTTVRVKVALRARACWEDAPPTIMQWGLWLCLLGRCASYDHEIIFACHPAVPEALWRGDWKQHPLLSS